MPGFPLARGSVWAGGRASGLNAQPGTQRWGTTSCRETAPLTYLLNPCCRSAGRTRPRRSGVSVSPRDKKSEADDAATTATLDPRSLSASVGHDTGEAALSRPVDELRDAEDATEALHRMLGRNLPASRRSSSHRSESLSLSREELGSDDVRR
jgi:hypothetical protein